MSSSTIQQSARLDAATARRRSRVAARLAGLDVEPDAAALAVLSGLAAREARRIPDGLRQTLDAADVAQSAAVRLLSTDAGRLTLAALTSSSDAARDAARRTARGAVRSIVGTAIRTGTAADVTADALTAEDQSGPLAFRVGTERDAVAAALAADGLYSVPDRDAGRTVALGTVAAHGRGAAIVAGRAAGLDAAGLDALGNIGAGLAVRHAAGRGGTFAAVREQTSARHAAGETRRGDAIGSVRILRETSLERLLTSTMRTGLPDAGRGAESAGRTLSGLLADRETAALYRDAFRAAVRRHAADTTGRGAAALAAAVAGLPSRDWTLDARAARLDVAAALDALDAADAARLDADAAARDHRGKVNAAAARAARTAHAAAERSAAHALDVWHVTNAAALDAADGRRPTLDGLAVLTLTTSADGLRTGAGRRRAETGTADRSTLSTAVLLDVVTGSRDTASNAAARLRSVLDAAAADALDGLAARPVPSARLAAHRSRDNAAARLPGSPPLTWSTLSVHRAARAADAARLAARRDAAARDAGRRVAAALRSAAAIWEPVLA